MKDNQIHAMTIDEALRSLEEEDEKDSEYPHDHGEDPHAHPPFTSDLEDQVAVALKGLKNTTDLQEAIIDLGAILNLWTSDVIMLALENVRDFNKRDPGVPSNRVIPKRQNELRRKLAAFSRSRKNDIRR